MPVFRDAVSYGEDDASQIEILISRLGKLQEMDEFLFVKLYVTCALFYLKYPILSRNRSWCINVIHELKCDPDNNLLTDQDVINLRKQGIISLDKIPPLICRVIINMVLESSGVLGSIYGLDEPTIDQTPAFQQKKPWEYEQARKYPWKPELLFVEKMRAVVVAVTEKLKGHSDVTVEMTNTLVTHEIKLLRGLSDASASIKFKHGQKP